MKLLIEAFTKFTCGLLLVGLLIFLPAGTFAYFGGWLLMGILFVNLIIVICTVFILFVYDAQRNDDYDEEDDEEGEDDELEEEEEESIISDSGSEEEESIISDSDREEESIISDSE